ncbi:MAG TPA: ATP-dependent DNA helicase, partial [Casimicrobiaceae bacterium]|nr:ATP-dependent DNA helicase [Casimicrobiaceae bacterium]
MAEAIALAIETRGQLLAEAGTGTGKTFAYLVPALLSGGKVIVSTGTKTLQDQLFQRDLPLIRDTLKVPVSVALLKGRGNYVCHHHLERASAQGTFASRTDAAYLPRIASFARTSTTGDKSELPAVPENAGIWADVTSTRENCLGSDCADYDRCFVMNARKQALAADVVVINHHLFFADVMLKDEGLTELLPACNTVILDEAHQLPDTATLFFGEEISAGSLGELARDAETEGLRSARDYAPLPDAAQMLAQALRRFRLSVGDVPGKWLQSAVAQRPGFTTALDTLADALAELARELAHQADR